MGDGSDQWRTRCSDSGPPAATSTLDGPIREYYLVGLNGTADDSRRQTEIGWPIFQTGTILLTGTGP